MADATGDIFQGRRINPVTSGTGKVTLATPPRTPGPGQNGQTSGCAGTPPPGLRGDRAEGRSGDRAEPQFRTVQDRTDG